MKKIKLTGLILLLISFQPIICIAQQARTLDMIVATVGKNIILKSEIETQYHQYLSAGNYANEAVKCQILEQALLSKLLLHQPNRTPSR
jgi:hypothetical protein